MFSMHWEVKIMKQSRHILFLVTLVVLACFSSSSLAQKREKRIIQGPIQGEAKQRDPSIFEMRRTPQPPNSIRVEIRYSKEYGYKSDSGFTLSRFPREVAGLPPQSFDAFAVFANPYGSRRPERPIPITRNSKMIEAGGYYVCEYLISELPLAQAITVSVRLANRDSPTEMWKGGSQPQPPPGQRRIILEPTRTVTLTRSRSRATLAFEMVYAPPPATQH